jgi:hypothetical protein
MFFRALDVKFPPSCREFSLDLPSACRELSVKKGFPYTNAPAVHGDTLLRRSRKHSEFVRTDFRDALTNARRASWRPRRVKFWPALFVARMN